MTRPTRNPKTQIFRLRKAVPPALRAVVGRRELEESLGTRDPAEARALAPPVLARIEARLALARDEAAGKVVRVSQRQIDALCGAWLREQVAAWGDNPQDGGAWDEWRSVLLDEVQGDATEGRVYQPSAKALARASRLLRDEGVVPAPESVELMAHRLWETELNLCQIMARRVRGDWSDDVRLSAPAAAAAPLAAAPAAPAPQSDPLPSETLLKAWATEAQRAPGTVRKYATTFAILARILGFDDVRRITEEDVVRFKQARFADGRNAKTVKDDILAAGAVCSWGVLNKLLPSNPFSRKAPKATRRGPAARVGYDDEDAARILSAARSETGFLRWAPWLQAFSGARVGEVADMRRGHVRQDSGVWVLDFLPLAERGGKNSTFQRMVPLHPAVEAEGFLQYVATLPADPHGPLFPALSAAPDGGRAGPASTKMGRWVRGTLGITDPRKAPNHAWRHRMEDELRKVRALPEMQDALTGRHNPRNAGAGYGKGFRGMPDEVLKDLRKVPSPVAPLGVRQPCLPPVGAPGQDPARRSRPDRLENTSG